MKPTFLGDFPYIVTYFVWSIIFLVAQKFFHMSSHHGFRRIWWWVQWTKTYLEKVKLTIFLVSFQWWSYREGDWDQIGDFQKSRIAQKANQIYWCSRKNWWIHSTKWKIMDGVHRSKPSNESNDTFNKAEHTVQSNATGKGCIILLSNDEQCWAIQINA